MHHWNDGDKVDWKGINDAAEYIGTNLAKYGRMSADYKEKFGTVRVYVIFGWYQIHSITHPRYHYSQYPKWLWHLDCNYGHYITAVLNLVAIPYHKFLYRLLYKRAVRKWPHLRDEIIYSADYYDELLRGI
jgi:hypothetical protein